MEANSLWASIFISFFLCGVVSAFEVFKYLQDDLFFFCCCSSLYFFLFLEKRQKKKRKTKKLGFIAIKISRKRFHMLVYSRIDIWKYILVYRDMWQYVIKMNVYTTRRSNDFSLDISSLPFEWIPLLLLLLLFYFFLFTLLLLLLIYTL